MWPFTMSTIHNCCLRSRARQNRNAYGNLSNSANKRQYSIVIAIVSWLDLNTLDNLSRTCRQVRENLLQYHKPLITRTLHCYKEQPPLEPEDNEMTWYHMSINAGYKRKGSCARDMVSECRRCATPVCRVSQLPYGLMTSPRCPF